MKTITKRKANYIKIVCFSFCYEFTSFSFSLMTMSHMNIFV